MCSPEIMLKVREAMTRRQMLGQTGAVAVAAVGAASVGHLTTRSVRAQDASPIASPTGGALPGGFSRIVDLSHTHGPDFPMYPGAASMTIEALSTVADGGFYKNLLTLDEHTGTHMDAPAHFTDGGTTADRLAPEQLLAPLVVIDISARAATDPDAEGTVDDITAWEATNGPLPAGAFVALHSGWESRLGDPTSYINADAEGVQHYPGWAPDAATFLVDERDIVGVGVDTLSLDFGASTTFASHITLLGAGKFGVENLANLAAVPAAGCLIVVGGPKHIDASGGPTRAFALI